SRNVSVWTGPNGEQAVFDTPDHHSACNAGTDTMIFTAPDSTYITNGWVSLSYLDENGQWILIESWEDLEFTGSFQYSVNYPDPSNYPISSPYGTAELEVNLSLTVTRNGQTVVW